MLVWLLRFVFGGLVRLSRRLGAVSGDLQNRLRVLVNANPQGSLFLSQYLQPVIDVGSMLKVLDIEEASNAGTPVRVTVPEGNGDRDWETNSLEDWH